MTDPPRDLTAERAANLYRSLTCTTYREGYQDPDSDIALLANAIKTARQDALREAARVCSEWHKIDRSNINSVADMAEVLATKLDRLASEGG